ncbi:MAG: hypothetical protein AB7V42_02805 [Thermoleophilia bacterium]
MSADLEDRLRAALREAEPGEDAGRRLLDRVAADLAARPRRRRLRRALRPAGVVLALAALAGLLVVLLVATPGEEPASPPRATGVEGVLRAVPGDPAATPAAVGAELTRALVERARARGITGFEATDLGDGRVRVFVPRTHDTGWISWISGGFRLMLYDGRASLVASSRRVESLLDRVGLPVGDGAPSAGSYYLMLPSPLGGTLVGPASTPAAARRLLPTAPSPGARVVRVGAGVTITYLNGRYAALRDPIVSPGDIEGARADGRRVTLQIAEGGRPAVAAAVGRGAGNMVLLRDTGNLAARVRGLARPVFDEAGGRLTFRSASAAQARRAVREIAGGGVAAAAIEVESATTVGPPPARRGERVRPLPLALRRMIAVRPAVLSDPARIRPATLLRVLTAREGGTAWALWSYLGENGQEYVALTGLYATFSGGGCAIAPDRPVLSVCGHGGSASSPATAYYGRVGDDVASVTAAFPDGRRYAAVVDNGFFLVVVPTSRPKASPRFIPRDASGREIPPAQEP